MVSGMLWEIPPHMQTPQRRVFRHYFFDMLTLQEHHRETIIAVTLSPAIRMKTLVEKGPYPMIIRLRRCRYLSRRIDCP